MTLGGDDWTEEDQQRYEENKKIKEVENNEIGRAACRERV